MFRSLIYCFSETEDVSIPSLFVILRTVSLYYRLDLVAAWAKELLHAKVSLTIHRFRARRALPMYCTSVRVAVGDAVNYELDNSYIWSNGRKFWKLDETRAESIISDNRCLRADKLLISRKKIVFIDVVYDPVLEYWGNKNNLVFNFKNVLMIVHIYRG